MALNQPAVQALFSLCLALAVVTGFSGCGKKQEQAKQPKITVTEAQKKFETKSREDYDLHVITKMAGRTMWIYLPTKEPIFDYEAQRENSADAERKPPKFAVQYIDGNFEEQRFFLEYDIINRKKSKKEDYGYSSSYTDTYVKQQNNLFTAISDVFFNGDIEEKETPRFFVIVITDIRKGIETRATLYLEDFKRYMSGDLPYDEYMKRFLADTKGGQSMIGDETGSHLEYKDVSMAEFLVKQIINRVNFKFQHSDFEPPDNYDDTIVGIVADTTRYYDFKEFQTVQLFNLRQEKKYLFEKNQLATFGEDPMKPPALPGKLIHIRFENGKAQF